MQEITKKIKDDALLKFSPLMEDLAGEGKTSYEIAQIFKSHVDRKIRDFYRKRDFRRLSEIIPGIPDLEKADSKAERIFYEMLVDSGLKLVFQRQIGPYRADYLIENKIVVELDGPQHTKEKDDKKDAYLRKMGYRVLRVPIWILACDPAAVIDEIYEALIGPLQKRLAEAK